MDIFGYSPIITVRISQKKYFEVLDTFGYSLIISEQLSDVLGGAKPPLNFRYGLRNNGGVSKSMQNVFGYSHSYDGGISKNIHIFCLLGLGLENLGLEAWPSLGKTWAGLGLDMSEPHHTQQEYL